MSRQHFSRVDRFAQMSKQEEVIAKKRQEILEKQKTAELAKQVAAAQSIASKLNVEESVSEEVEPPEPQPTQVLLGIANQSKLKNTFCNDGSFLTHFKKILEKHKPEPPPPEPEPEMPLELESDAQAQQETIETDDFADQHLLTEQPQEIQPQEQQMPLDPPPMPPMEIPHPPIAPSSFFNLAIPPPILNLQVTVPPPPPPPPPVPQPLQQCIPPLYMIPPPEPLQLNTIPPPKEFDLNAIPKPELNLDAIQVPSEAGDKVFSDNSNDSITLPSSLETLIDLVADFGDGYEDKIRSHKNLLHPSLWFLFEKDTEQYINYRKEVEASRLDQQQQEQQLYEQDEMENFELAKSATPFDDKYDPECVMDRDEDSDDEYMRGMMDRNRDNLKRRIECRNEIMEEERVREENKKKQRKSRWGEKSEEIPLDVASLCTFANQNKPVLSAVQRTDPALLQYARQNYGTTELEEDEWKKCEEHFKVNLLYQDMLKKRQEIDRLARCGKFKYEYDSDEDVTGGTWEHKLRNAEMEATNAWASALTKQSEGKHHIGDFLPPEELKKFMEQYEAKKSNRMPDLSDYKEYKLREDNVGFQMLQKLGWKEGQGLGSAGTGIVDPVNKAPQRDGNQGLGVTSAAAPEDCDNEYDAYRKRMMLAYRFRPNPLNNPRRAYY